ncbi:MAG: lysylphosphatidylglycerol synthase transmembrane domain-containing protein [Methylococcales bacterium]
MTKIRREPDGKAAASILQNVLHSTRFRSLVTLILIALLGSRLDSGKIFRTLDGFDGTTGLLMLAVNIVLILVFAKRWQVIAAGLKLELPYGQLVRAIWLATFLGQFGPTLLIAEATRFQMIRKHATTSQLIVSQILDRISGQIVLFMIVLLLFPMYVDHLQTSFSKLLFGLSGMILAVALIFRFLYPGIRSLLQTGAREAIELLGWRGLAGHYSLSLIVQLLLILNFSLAAAGIGVLDRLLPFLVTVPLVFATITLLPITISDWGSRESAAVILLSPSGLGAETIVSVSVLYGLFHLLAAVPGGLFLVYNPLGK